MTQRTPVEVRAPRGARVMELVWSDGEITRHPHEVLRGFCPCAHCQGHQGPLEWRGVPSEQRERALELVEIEEMGQYALRLGWGDGHATGIYTFTFLAELGPWAERSEAELATARFSR